MTTRGLLVTSLLGAASFVFAADENPIKVTGTVDVYYLRDFNEGPGDANLRFLDTRKNKLTLNTALAKIRYTPKKTPFSASVDLGVGKMQDLTNASEPGGTDRYKVFQQAFVSYAGKAVNVDFGKFVTWVGYENLEPSENANYSHGFLSNLGVPTYHFGLRAGFKANDMDLTAAIVRGWNEVEDSNGQLSYGLQAKKNLSDKTTVTANFMGGGEGKNGQTAGIAFADGLKRDTYTYDVILTHKLDDTTDLAFEGLYGNALGKGGNPSAKWTGVSGWVSKKFNDKMTGALRIESFNDSDGQRTGTAQNLTSVTLTAGYKLSPNSHFRLELRGDRSNQSVFTKENAANTKNRSTLSGAYILKF
ncbi:MAG: porin [Chthonomonas sp.]|nr:porin [Chthonomonas sp.]